MEKIHCATAREARGPIGVNKDFKTTLRVRCKHESASASGVKYPPDHSENFAKLREMGVGAVSECEQVVESPVRGTRVSQ